MKRSLFLGLLLGACSSNRFSTDVFAGTALDSGPETSTASDGGSGAPSSSIDAGHAGASQAAGSGGEAGIAGDGGEPQGGAVGSGGEAGGAPTGGSAGAGAVTSGGGAGGSPTGGAAGSYLGGAGGAAGGATECSCVFADDIYSTHCGDVVSPCENWCVAGECMGICGPSDRRCEGTVAKWCSSGDWIDYCWLSSDPSNHAPCCPP